MREMTIGASADYVHRVRPQDCATAWGNDLPVLATPVLLWLAEITCMKLMDGVLDAGEMTVGVGHDSQHLGATPENWEVRVSAKLTRVDGRSLCFEVAARDAQQVVFAGTHTRAVVDRSKFVAKLERKAARS